MADQNQVKMLQKSVKEWNEWRNQHLGIIPDLTRTNLTGANLIQADLAEADLTGATLTGTNFTRANLAEADFTWADLTKADLTGADLTKADLTKADLTGATLTGATLTWADLTEAGFGGTTLAHLDFRSIRGLINIHHGGPSTIELYSITLPQDGSALHFLRGAGVPDEWIADYHARMMQPIQYHSVFISYSSSNEDIAKRLHADLQANGVRCWFAPHNLKPGDFFRQEIDKAIHLQDKLLLILSHDAICSNWVEYEVNQAIDREIAQRRNILFPIRIDETVLHRTDDWAADIRARRHISDFTNWKDHTTYQNAFTQLLKHLKEDIKKS